MHQSIITCDICLVAVETHMRNSTKLWGESKVCGEFRKTSNFCVGDNNRAKAQQGRIFRKPELKTPYKREKVDLLRKAKLQKFMTQ